MREYEHISNLASDCQEVLLSKVGAAKLSLQPHSMGKSSILSRFSPEARLGTLV